MACHGIFRQPTLNRIEHDISKDTKTITYQFCNSRIIFAETCHLEALKERITKRHLLPINSELNLIQQERQFGKLHFLICVALQ